jgi:hypothetical protein
MGLLLWLAVVIGVLFFAPRGREQLTVVAGLLLTYAIVLALLWLIRRLGGAKWLDRPDPLQQMPGASFGMSGEWARKRTVESLLGCILVFVVFAVLVVVGLSR